jgi:hypothetical protein
MRIWLSGVASMGSKSKLIAAHDQNITDCDTMDRLTSDVGIQAHSSSQLRSCINRAVHGGKRVSWLLS